MYPHYLKIHPYYIILGQKLGYDRCPYLSFFVRRFEDEMFDSTGRRDLNTKVHQFWTYDAVKCS